MIPCAHTLATPDLDLTEAIALFADLGFEAVEILIDHDYPSAVAPLASAGTVARLRSRLDGARLRCAHVTPYVRTLDALDDAVRRDALAAMEDAIRIAAALGAGGVRVLAGRSDGPQLAARRDAFVASMRLLSRVAGTAGVSLNVETKGWSFAADATSIRLLLDSIGTSEVGVLLDPANIVLDGADVVLELTQQLAHVRHVHFKDVRWVGDTSAGGRSTDGGSPTRSTWLPCPAGDGAVPWPTVFAALKRAGYVGHVSIEYERRWHAVHLPATAEGLVHELGTLRALLAASSNGEAL